jgi:fatty-acyl-CoA synthase
LLHDQLVSYASALELSPADRIISWLPLYHDMGLVACLLMPFVFRLPLIMFAPMEWVMDPSPFLEAMGQEMATLCWLPNFAFSFLASRVQPTNRLDFSSVRALINCSEPVRAESMDAFLGRFASRGLRPEALHTCYAMAESTFAITQTTERAPPKRILVSKSAFGRGQIEPSSSGERILVSCGTPIPATDVKVVDDGGDICAEGTIGEIRVRGSSVMDGYLDARANLNSGRPVFVDGWYCTGDLGALREGHLYVTGRRKDLIIVGGVNVYPEDIEAAASELHGIHAGRAVAMGLLDERLGTERLVVVAEAEGAIEATDREKLELAVRAAAVAVSGIAPHKVFVVPPKWIVKSTAGKISRVETKDRVLARWDDLIAGLEMTKNAEA